MFKIGDKIVYPMHGAGIIEKMEKKEILGEEKEYFILRMPIGDLEVMVPVGTLADVGVREIIDESQIPKVFEILNTEIAEMDNNWNRRYRENMERIKTGDINEVAEVLKNLAIMDQQKGLSTGERKMLTTAKQILLSELVLASKKTPEELEEIIEKAISIE